MFLIDDIMLAAFAETAAAEAAAAAAAEAATIEAAQIAAAEAAATTAAQQAAAQQATQAGIMGIEGAAANAPLTAEAVQSAAMNSGLPLEPVFQSGQGMPPAVTSPVIDGGITSVPQAAPPAVPSPVSPVNTMGLEMPGAYAPPSNYPMGMDGQFTANQFIKPGSAGMPSMENTIAQANIPVTPPSGLEAGFDKALKFAEKNPFTAMTLAYTGANALGLMNPSGATFNQEKYNGPLSKYKLSPNFKPGSANPADFQYRPRYAAGGGIMGAGSYDIPVGYDEGGPVALPLPSRTMRSSDAFQVPGQPQDASQFAAADAYNDILRNRVIADTSTNRLNDANLGYYQATPNELANTAGNTKFGFSSTMAQKELASRSNEGEFAVPGYGDLGQFAGGGNDNYASRFGGSASFNALKDDNPYNVDAFAKGGSLSDSIAQYQKMLGGQQQAAPARSADVGIYYDQDPDTRYQDALTAAQIRQAKVNQRAYVSPPAAKRPEPLGRLNMPTSAKSKGDVEAASGGIMQSSLGGYAAGGNPRLLKGPGDGMSDNIPATINGRQPARLADGEFVIPADVVSHLGNGSTEAGAKHLHAMMNKVRKARTGNPKQGKQIKPQKYMPK
jgi:hypothetical protein